MLAPREEVDRLAAYAESEARIPLTILTAASREAGELTGRIPALIESGALEAKAGAAFTPESARLLLCGNPDFIRETRALMKARGIVSPRLGKPGQLLVESLCKQPSPARPMTTLEEIDDLLPPDAVPPVRLPTGCLAYARAILEEGAAINRCAPAVRRASPSCRRHRPPRRAARSRIRTRSALRRRTHPRA